MCLDSSNYFAFMYNKNLIQYDITHGEISISHKVINVPFSEIIWFKIICHSVKKLNNGWMVYFVGKEAIVRTLISIHRVPDILFC